MEERTEVEVYILLFGGIAVMLLLVVVIVISVILYQRRVMLKNQQILQIQNAYQKDLLQASLVSEEQTRERIARDLHDEVGATLSTTKLYLAQLKGSPDLAHAHEIATQANELVARTIQNIRLISKDLSPAVLTNMGIGQALRDIVESINASKAVQVHLDCDAAIPRFDKIKELMLYRIAQELLNNSLKHAEPKHISLVLRCYEGKRIMFTYQDDGKGFDTTGTHKGLGLKNIESRTDILGGKATFFSKENEGVRFEVEITLTGAP